MKSDFRQRRGILTRGSDKKDLEATALHEAAHAVISHMLGEKVVLVEITGPRTGQTRTMVPARDPNKTRWAIAALAGHEVECLVYKRPVNLLPADDWKLVTGRCGLDPLTASWLRYTVVKMVKAYLPAIKRVAKVLYKKRHLTKRSFLKALKKKAR